MDEKYLQDLYEWIKSNDSSYEGRYSYDQFKQKIQDENYASQMHKWISGIDNTFEERRPLDAFIKLVKQPTQQPMAQEQQPIKKKEDWESSWFGGDGTSESEPSGTSTFDKAQKFLSSQQPKEQVKPKQELDLEYVMGTDIAKKQFEQKMTPKREENLTRPLEQIKIEETAKQVEGERIEKTPKFLRPLVEEIDKDFMTRPTQTVVPELNYLYGDAGFKFSGPSRQGLINATSPDGETLSVNIGMIGYNTDAEIAKLKNFIRDKSSKISNIKSIEDKYLGENMKFLNKKQIDDEMKSLNESAESIKNEFKGYLAEKTKLEELQKKINEYPQNLKATPEYNALIEEYNATVENNNSKSEFINQARESIIASENNLKKAAGDYTKMKEGQGNFLGAMWDETMSGLGSMAAWWSDFTTNRYWDNVPLTYALGAENYKDLFELKKEELNKGLPEGVTVLDDKINQAIRDDMKKLQKYGKIEAPDGFKFEIENITQKELRDFFKENLGATTTSDEYTRKIQQEGNIVQRGLLGLAKSAPAMVGPSFVRILNMYSQTTDAISEEMENDPDFKYVSEAEKERIGVPIGIVGAALEEFGFRNALKGTSIVKNLTGRVINRLPAGATASQIRTAAIQEIKNMGVKGTLALTGSALAEAETGASQQIAEYALKDIYNIMKGKEMFDTPDFFSEKYLMDVADAAATETVGALVLGTPNAIASAFQKDGFQGLDDATFKIFEEISKDADSRKFFVVNLKNKINAGEITSDQGKNILSAYDQASGMISQVTDEITDVNDRKIAMDLMAERKRLENKKEGKDPALSKPIQDKIDKINEQLTQLTQDAIQKQATSEVSLQPEAEPSKEMEAGGPEAGPEAAPKQGVLSPEESKRKEELTTALQNIEAGATAVTIGEATMDIADAQAELDAILQKEQAIPEAQKQTITDIFTAAPTETKQSIIFKSPNGIIVSMVGNEQMAAQLYEEAIATPEEQRSQQQNNIVEKMQPLVTAAAPAIEVTPEAAPVQPVETFTEQDKARQQELTDALAKADKRRKNITVGETVMPKADVKAELDALNQKELS
jgi:hypothetical protein